MKIIRDCGQMIGDVLASLVNFFFNSSPIFIGGGIANFGNYLLVTRHLSINFSYYGFEGWRDRGNRFDAGFSVRDGRSSTRMV
ncbi:MAG TPA: hypothetical protein VJM08_05765 [Anaerolineales bacterium]|nr:hypothetical protein [Anaerolineales bacterium]